MLVWLLDSPTFKDSLDLVLPFDEAILEAMTKSKRPWEDMHHHSYFLHGIESLENVICDSTSDREVDWYRSPFATHDMYAEGNMANISKTIPINISQTPGVTENILIGVGCSPKEIVTYTSPFK